MAPGAVRLRKSYDIVILSFCNIVKGQAKYHRLSDSQIKFSQKKETLYGLKNLSNFLDEKLFSCPIFEFRHTCSAK